MRLAIGVGVGVGFAHSLALGEPRVDVKVANGVADAQRVARIWLIVTFALCQRRRSCFGHRFAFAQQVGLAVALPLGWRRRWRIGHRIAIA